jgi:hypothetical protein
MVPHPGAESCEHNEIMKPSNTAKVFRRSCSRGNTSRLSVKAESGDALSWFYT